MTEKQIVYFKKLRNRLRNRDIKNIPTVLKIQNLDSQKAYILLKVLKEQIVKLNKWEYSSPFRQTCFDKFGSDFSIKESVEENIQKTLHFITKKH